ncbi:MAG: peptidoglycan DD-metalloendopeptidase family protein [Clostridia bacterium]|nr:peptidoglycan DD-metalloendopeptidase family protein [Clostridia bacterium]
MLEYIFKAVLITSLIGTVSAVLFALIKPLTKKYFSASWHYYIWLIVLVTMVTPFRFIMPEKTFVADIQEDAIIQQENYVENNPVLEFVKNEEVFPQVDNVTEGKIANIKGFAEDKISILSIIWLGGAMAFLVFKVIAYILFVLKLQRASQIISCEELKQYTNKKIITRTSSKIVSPLMVGTLRPTLLLPEAEMTEEQLDNVLAHEMVHFKRKDIIYKWFVCFVKCIHWFNPMVYYVAKQVDIECEISCDLAVVKNMNKEQESSYIDTILALVTAKKQQKTAVTTAMAGDKKSLKRRFSMIKNKGKISKKAIIISVIIAFVVLVGSVLASGILNGKFISNYENELLAVNTDARQSDDFNFLFVGIDKQNNADSLMVLSAEDGKLSGVSFLRETVFIIDGIKASASEIVNGVDGNQRIIDVVKNTLSVPINYYAKVNLTVIEKLVDSVGGIEIDVPIDMEYDDPEQNLHIKIKQGRHTLNGSAACGLLQFRRSNNGNGYGDVVRTKMGQEFVKEFINQKLNKEFINKSPEIFKELAENIETNYPVSKLLGDIRMLSNMKSDITFKVFDSASITDDTGFMLYEEENGEVISVVAKPKLVPDAHNESKVQPETKVKLARPCDGTITNHFGKRVHPITNEVREHNGIDIKAPEGTEVVSSMIGTVTDVGFDAEKGNYIVVEKDNVKTIYSQLSATNVKKGDNISINQSIGAVGSTGNSTGAHLHFEVMIDGEYVDPESLMP